MIAGQKSAKQEIVGKESRLTNEARVAWATYMAGTVLVYVHARPSVLLVSLHFGRAESHR